MSTKQNNTGTRQGTSELEQLRARVEYLEARLAKTGEERDALAAHGERLHDSVIAVLDTTIVWSPEHFELKRRLIDKPAISLTRRDALKQAEALDHQSRELEARAQRYRDDHPEKRGEVIGMGAAAEIVKLNADVARHQAEVIETLDRMGSGAEALVREIEGTQDKESRS